LISLVGWLPTKITLAAPNPSGRIMNRIRNAKRLLHGRRTEAAAKVIEDAATAR
jgi:hypothetical protein